MSRSHTLTLAYSSCPNDTFIFHALAKGQVDTGGIDLRVTLADVETLNQAADSGLYDVTKLSFAALGRVTGTYGLLRSGAALGRGCGPLIITRPGWSPGTSPIRVAVPGMGTTAFLLCRFFMEESYPDAAVDFIPMPFETVMPAVLENRSDIGVIIHEGRFVFQGLGLSCLVDLGQWWEDNTGLPIPLGCIAIRRDLGMETARRIDGMIRSSLEHARRFPEKSLGYIRNHAQELDERVIDQHIGLYVNDFSLDIGQEGETAIRAFFDRARKAGIMPDSDQPLFAF